MPSFTEDAERAMVARRSLEEFERQRKASGVEEQRQALFSEVSATFATNREKAQKQLLSEQQSLVQIGAIELLRQYQKEMWPGGIVTVEEGSIRTETPTVITAEDYVRGAWSTSVRGKPLKTGVVKISPSVSLGFNYPDWISRFDSDRVVAGHEMSAGVKQAFLKVSVHTGYPRGRYVRERYTKRGDDRNPDERIFIMYKDEHYNNDINDAFARYMAGFQGGSVVAYEQFADGFWGGSPDFVKKGPVIIDYNEETAKIVRELIYKDYRWRKATNRFPSHLEEDGRKRIANNTPKKRTVLDLFRRG